MTNYVMTFVMIFLTYRTMNFKHFLLRTKLLDICDKLYNEFSIYLMDFFFGYTLLCLLLTLMTNYTLTLTYFMTCYKN